MKNYIEMFWKSYKNDNEFYRNRTKVKNNDKVSF